MGPIWQVGGWDRSPCRQRLGRKIISPLVNGVCIRLTTAKDKTVVCPVDGAASPGASYARLEQTRQAASTTSKRFQVKGGMEERKTATRGAPPKRKVLPGRGPGRDQEWVRLRLRTRVLARLAQF